MLTAPELLKLLMSNLAGTSSGIIPDMIPQKIFENGAWPGSRDF